jgi:uncharacterized protein YqgQ
LVEDTEKAKRMSTKKHANEKTMMARELDRIWDELAFSPSAIRRASKHTLKSTIGFLQEEAKEFPGEEWAMKQAKVFRACALILRRELKRRGAW